MKKRFRSKRTLQIELPALVKKAPSGLPLYCHAKCPQVQYEGGHHGNHVVCNAFASIVIGFQRYGEKTPEEPLRRLKSCCMCSGDENIAQWAKDEDQK